jgi:pimeloyl-ACP methyl ester carboxylesterase
MQLLDAFAATGGRDFDPGQRVVVFIHGAGLDHSVWALHSRWFAYHGWSVLALDLPGHGRSAGPVLPSIGAMADWVIRAVLAAGAERAMLVGHSMGALVALDAAARHPAQVSALALIGAAAAMPVHPDLLAAALANDPAAMDMVSLWGYGAHATLGGSEAPGLWMLGAGMRVLERAAPGVLYNDLAACNEFAEGLEDAARIACPVTMIAGERDVMTPLKAGKSLAAAIAGARLVVLAGAGHMLMAERPGEVLDALAR